MKINSHSQLFLYTMLKLQILLIFFLLHEFEKLNPHPTPLYMYFLNDQKLNRRKVVSKKNSELFCF